MRTRCDVDDVDEETCVCVRVVEHQNGSSVSLFLASQKVSAKTAVDDGEGEKGEDGGGSAPRSMVNG